MSDLIWTDTSVECYNELREGKIKCKNCPMRGTNIRCGMPRTLASLVTAIGPPRSVTVNGAHEYIGTKTITHAPPHWKVLKFISENPGATQDKIELFFKRDNTVKAESVLKMGLKRGCLEAKRHKAKSGQWANYYYFRCDRADCIKRLDSISLVSSYGGNNG